MEFCRRRDRNLPCALTAAASNLSSSGCSNGPTFYLKCFSVQESVGDGFVRVLENPSKRGPRDIHLGRGMLVLIPVKVSKTNRLQFIQ